MNEILKLFLVSAIVLISIPITSSTSFGNNCLIHNVHYKFEYVYVADSNQVFVTSLKHIKDFSALSWQFLPVPFTNHNNDQTNQEWFYLKSVKYGPSLCALNTFADQSLLSKRRQVKARDIKDEEKDCQWRMDKVSNEESGEEHGLGFNLYVIRNRLNEKELLYPGSFLFKFQWDKRKTLLWRQEKANGTRGKVGGEFKWHIDCQTGEFLTI